MANEIYATFDEGETLYVLIWRKTDDKVWNNTDSQWDTYTDADIDKYDVVLANQADSDYYSVDFPSAITTAGSYRVQIMWQQGGSIDADVDFGIYQGEIEWDGTEEITQSYIIVDLDAHLDDIEDLVDLMLVELQRVNNVYEEAETAERLVIVENL
jgi:hypothetical protein